MERPSWTEYFMQFAELARTRSTCLRRKVGAVIVKDRKILATGYNGAPAGIEHCSVLGCLREKLNIPSGERHEICRGLHAEQNAIIQASYHGVSIKEADIYCTHLPCIICTKMIINAGIKRILYLDGYAIDDITGQLAIEMIKESGIELVQFGNNIENLYNKEAII